MADMAFQNATARRESIALEISSMQARIEDLRKEAKRVDEWLATYNEFAGTPGGSQETPAFTKPSHKNPLKEEVADFAYKLIKDRGRPVPRNYISAALAHAGMVIEGKDPDMILSTMLWRMSNKVVRIRKIGYWMADKDFPEAEYVANSESKGDGHPSLDEESESDNHSYLSSVNNPGVVTVAN